MASEDEAARDLERGTTRVEEGEGAGPTDDPPAGTAAADGDLAAGPDRPGDGPGGVTDGPIVDDPDEPENPDEQTQAEAEAARDALASTRPRRPYRGPRSILMLLFIVALVIATGVYALFWYQRIKESDDRGELRRLEEREVMVRFQRRSTWLRFGPDAKVLPAGVVYEPLTPAERGRMLRLQQRFAANQFKPDEKQDGLVREVHEMEAARGLKPTGLDATVAVPGTGPATVP